MYQPRNPYTPQQGEAFTPQQYLSRYLYFYRWEAENKSEHLQTCSLDNRFELLKNGFCCLGYLKQYIDSQLLEVAGCQTGFWVEPVGFQVWLSFAWKRLEELEEGHDYFELWDKTLRKEGREFFAWMENTPFVNRPGFSAYSFLDACRKYSFQPDTTLVSICFD